MHGKGSTEYHKIAEALEAGIYFVYPFSSWEKSINENTNELIRPYFEKGTDLRELQ